MIATNYNPKESEEKWYKYWMDHKLFHSEVDNSRQPYCVVIPPPNVTGVLHMGHMLNNTIQDAMVHLMQPINTATIIMLMRNLIPLLTSLLLYPKEAAKQLSAAFFTVLVGNNPQRSH